jgi:N-acetylneuraminate lyase
MTILSAIDPPLLPALVTPLLPSGELDERSAARLIDFLYDQGVGGLYLTGSTGEGIWLAGETRRGLVEIACERSRGRAAVIVHVGSVQAGEAIALAAHAAEAGALAVSSIPPFAGGYSWEEIHSFYLELTTHSPLPVIAYYIPGLTGISLTTDQLRRLLALPQMMGLKWTDPNLFAMQRLATRMRPDQVLFNGPDEMLALGLQFGAHGGIGTTYNVLPRLVLEIYASARQGAFARAVACQLRANEVIEALLASHVVAATKQVLVWQGLIDHPTCAFPRAGLNDEQRTQLRSALASSAIAETIIR